MSKSKKGNREFEVGQQVLAKWPKSSLFFKGQVIDFNDIEYLIRFEDEGKSEYPIKFKDVQLQFPASRNSRSRSRGRSPGRKKSPGRKTPTTKSPRQRSKSRASPSKSTGVAGATELSLRTRSSKTAAVDKILLSSSALSGRRQSARLADKSSDSGKRLKIDLKAIVSAVRGDNRVYRGVRRGAKALWMSATALILPLVILLAPFVLSLMCNAKTCSFTWVEFPRKVSSYYDQKAVLYSLGTAAAVLLLALLPVGKLFKTKSGAEVRCNGFVTLILLSLVAVGVIWKQYNVSPIFLLFRHFLVTFSALGLVISLLLYIKSFFVPRSSLYSKGNTGYHVVDFVKGRELNPKIRGYDIKFLIYRMAVSLIMILNYLIVIKDLQAKHGQYSPTLLLCCGLQIFFALDLFIFEDTFFSTFEYLREGTGMTTVCGYLTAPFLLTVYSRFILNHGSELPWYHLVCSGLACLLGYMLYRGATSQKHAFKVNPNDPALAQLESLPAASGKRLLVSGWFGRVRHPQILADIVVNLGLASLCGCNVYVPYAVAALMICCVLGRMVVEERACKNEFGLAWNNYVTRVPYRVIPKVF